jgi:hypothetical protein
MQPLELVTIAEAKAQLRIDDSADDAWLGIFIPAVSQAIALWLKDVWRLYVVETDADGNVIEDSSGTPIPVEDSNGPVVNPVVKGAVLIELASQTRFREGDGENRMESLGAAAHGYILSRGATALLSGLRKPTVA